MVGMTDKMAPTVITGQRHFGLLLLMLRTMAGWTHRQSGVAYGCAQQLVGLRERGKRAVNIQQGVDIVGQHGYVLVMMHGNDATQLHRLRPGYTCDCQARPVG